MANSSDLQSIVNELAVAAQDQQDIIRDLSGSMSVLVEVFNKTAKNIAGGDPELKKLVSSLGKAKDATDKNTDAENKNTKAIIDAKEKAESFAQALKSGQAASLAFGKALLDSNVKLTNYGDALTKAGNAAFEFGKSLGPTGMIIGGILKGATALSRAQLDQAEKYLEAKDQLSKMGGAGSYTTESLRNMAREADLNKDTLGRMIKPMKELGSNIMILGQGAGDSQKEFAKLIKATDEERARFSRLGFTQEDMMKGTADYIALQAAAGINLKNQTKDQNALRKSSQEYLTSLVDLAALTGKDVEELKKKQQAALNDRQFMTANLAMQVKEDKLRKEAEKAGREGNEARKKELLAQADAVKTELAGRTKVLASLAGAPDVVQKAVKEIMTTGTVSGENAIAMSTMGLTTQIYELADTVKKGGDAELAAARFQDQAAKGLTERMSAMSGALNVGGDALNKQLGNSVEMQSWLNASRNRSYEQEVGEQREKRKKAEQEGDKAADTRAAAQNITIQATGKLDDLIAATNPLIGEFDTLKAASIALSAAATAAALALGAIALKKGVGGILGGAAGEVSGGGGKFPGGGLGGAGKLVKGAGIAGAVLGGWEIGSAIGDALKPVIDKGMEKVTGTKGETLGTAVYGAVDKLSKVLGKSSEDLQKKKELEDKINLGLKKIADGEIISKDMANTLKQAGKDISKAKISETERGQVSPVSGGAAKPGSTSRAATPPTKPTALGATPTSGGGTAATVGSTAAAGTGATTGSVKKTAPSSTPEKLKPASGKGGTMSETDIKKMIMGHEGIRYEPYKDSEGLWTVGVGHLIGDGRSLPPQYNRKFSHEEIMAMFDKDYDKHKQLAQSNVPNFNKYDSMGQGAFIDLTFNQGGGWPKKFKKASEYIAAGNTFGAARELENSLWYRQVKNRGPEIVNMVENSKVQARYGGLASGPDSGYPAMLHGKEMITPIKPDSILEKLMKTASGLEQNTTKQTQNNDFRDLVSINSQMMTTLSGKLESVIHAIDRSNGIQEKILRAQM